MASPDPFNISSSPAVVPDGQNLTVDNNHSATDQALLQEPAHHQALADSGAQYQTEDSDISMFLDDYATMPTLEDISDSDQDCESDRDAHEVEMEVDSENSPLLLDATAAVSDPSSSSGHRSSTFEPPIRSNSIRRARVEDDDDDERDRRHPSQRVSSTDRNVASVTSPSFLPLPRSSQNSILATESTSTPSIQTPTPAHDARNLDPSHPFNLFHPFAVPANTNNNAGHNNNAPAASDNQLPPQQPQVGNDNVRSLFGGMSFSVEIGPGFHIHAIPGPDIANGIGPQTAEGQPPPVPNAANPNPPRSPLGDLLGILGQIGGGLGGETIINLGNFGFGPQEKDDPERAKKLVDGLEEVPVGLVRRLERVGGIGVEAGEEPTNGGDAGCAICWDKLLDADGEGFGKEERAAIDEADKESGSSEPQPQQSKIVSLPCAHVFHADCLLPWFARPKHTTCPTCRFNIDPEDLTHASMRRRQRTGDEASQANQTEGEPSTDQSANVNNPEVTTNEGDRLPPDITFLPGGDFDGQGANPPNELHDNLREIFGEYQRQRNAAAAAPAVNPIPTGTTTAPGPANNEPLPPVNGAAAMPVPPRMANISSTILQTPLGRMGVIQVPVPVMVPFPFSATTPGQTPTPVAAPNVPDGDVPLPVDPPVPHNHTQEIARLLRQFLRRGAPPTVPFNSLFPPSFFHLNHQQPQPQPPQPQQQPQPQQPPQTANAGNTVPGGQNELPETNNNNNNNNNNNVAPGADGAQGERNNSNNSRNTTTQPPPPPNARRAVMEIRVDMVIGQDPFGGLFNGENGQPGQPPLDANPNEAFRNAFQAAMNAGAEGHPPPPLDGDFMARQQELQQRLAGLVEMRRRLETDLAAVGILLPPPFQMPFQQPNTNVQPPQQQPPQPPIQQQQTQQQQQQQQQPQVPRLDNIFAGLGQGGGVHLTGTGRSMSEAFAQMFGGMRPPTEQGQAGLGPQPGTQNEQPPGPSSTDGNNNTPQQTAPAGNIPLPNGFPTLGDLFGDFIRARRRPPPPYKDWTLPPAPGPTLRQRVERREREAGLRCHDVSCWLGPSDEDPFGDESGQTNVDVKQLAIMSKDDRSELCTHRFHGSCLVSAERVALRGAEAVIEDGNVEVSCPVCRGAGCVSKKDWDEGVVSLQ